MYIRSSFMLLRTYVRLKQFHTIYNHKIMGLFYITCDSKARLDGKTVLITGANAGLGKSTAENLYKRGAQVILACRNEAKANAAIDEIKSKNSKHRTGHLKYIHLDLASFASIRNCAKTVIENEKYLHILINNAGVFCTPYDKTEDGYELQFGINYLGHFLLTMLLLPKLIQSKNARIVNVASILHFGENLDLEDFNYKRRIYAPFAAYRHSKLCTILFTRELSKRLKDENIDGVNVYAVHPGTIYTNALQSIRKAYGLFIAILAHLYFIIFGSNAENGSQSIIFCAIDEKCKDESGLYYSNCAAANTSEQARNNENSKKLWDTSLKLCKIDSPF